ncbi:MAG: ATP-binding protein [Methylocystis silviterrae]|jgi:predicted AAA+ superfamily ATPase|uniref:ATP-binding protein n=1 Tax=Methylocystis silviterrae TaxID=2743612 RepID=UPI003C787AE6
MIIPRPRVEQALRQSLARAPAVVLLGPRQIGKTTLAKKLAENEKGAIYLDLEKAADLRRLEDAGAFLRSQPGRLVIIDEVHRLPNLFAELRGIIDERRAGGIRTGQFLLLGSASLDLVQHASETLAGRVIYLDLAPIAVDEARGAGVGADTLWLRGGFPESLIAADDAESFEWRRNFIRSYLERDVPMFAPRMPSNTIGRLWTMLANAQGSLLNSARLAQGLGVSAPMINRYIDLLVDLMLVRRLQPWSGNLNKRLVRSPKVYVRDSGVVHALLELETLDQLLGHPVVGPSWEGFVIETLIDAAGPRRAPMFYRTQDGAEIDLLFERAGKIEMALEIKRSTAPKVERGFFLACDDLQIERRFVVYSGQEGYPISHGATVLSLEEAVTRLR